MIGVLRAVVHTFFPSPGVAGAPTCKYHPTCSQYAHDAIHKYGLLQGTAKAVWRILRCNPWSKGGVDYA